MPRKAHNVLIAMLCGGVLAAGGCRFEKPDVFAEINYHLASPQALSRLDRVVFVELDDASGHPGVARATTRALYKSIQARRLFHLDVVWREDPLCRDVPLDRREAFTLTDLTAIRKELRCDALLFGKITNFMPYPRMQMGLYLRLLDLKEGKLLWGVDHIWDMTDRKVERRAEKFFRDHMRDLYGPADAGVLLMSPAAFQRFVAFEISQTMAPPNGETSEQESALTDRRSQSFRTPPTAWWAARAGFRDTPRLGAATTVKRIFENS
jgi:hypothetical protein